MEGIYRFRFARLCFCIGDEPVIIEVAADTITSVTDANTGDPVDPQYLDIDYQENMIDDEISYRASELVELL